MQLRSRLSLLTAGATALLLLSGCGSEGDAEEAPPRTFVLQTDWYAQPETGGFWQAQAKGFFEAEGASVEVRPSVPSMINTQVVASGNAQFGITRIDDIILGNARGMDLVAVSTYMRRSPIALMAHPENPAEAIPDLDGKTVMITVGKPHHLWIERHFGIDIKDIPHNFSTARFLSDPQRTFVQQVYLTNEPYHVAREDGQPPKLFPLYEAGFKTFLCLYTTRSFAEANPEVVRAVVKAAARGWRDYITGDPSPGNALITSHSEKYHGEYLDWTIEQIRVNQLIEGEIGFDGAFYEIPRDRAIAQAEQLAAYGQIDDVPPVDTYASWDYLPSSLD